MAVRDAGATRGAPSTGSAADFLPDRPTLPRLRAAAAGCRGCHLWTIGTQTVFGEGPRSARVIFVGEQPGDQEDLAGRPFVGPAGRLLDEALLEVGIDRAVVYVTNAVKHFKWERGEKGKRRIHKKPNDAEVRACHPWLEEEIRLLEPLAIVALGATAAQSMLGKRFRVTKSRGRPMSSPLADAIFATVHPSAVLRALPGDREKERRQFVADLKKVARWLSDAGKAGKARSLAG
ncbi:MAG: UdgX family uracil-DNA binding protein [Gemmatimonadaceae bacterium]